MGKKNKSQTQNARLAAEVANGTGSIKWKLKKDQLNQLKFNSNTKTNSKKSDSSEENGDIEMGESDFLELVLVLELNFN